MQSGRWARWLGCGPAATHHEGHQLLLQPADRAFGVTWGLMGQDSAGPSPPPISPKELPRVPLPEARLCSGHTPTAAGGPRRVLGALPACRLFRRCRACFGTPPLLWGLCPCPSSWRAPQLPIAQPCRGDRAPEACALGPPPRACQAGPPLRTAHLLPTGPRAAPPLGSAPFRAAATLAAAGSRFWEAIRAAQAGTRAQRTRLQLQGCGPPARI